MGKPMRFTSWGNWCKFCFQSRGRRLARRPGPQRSHPRLTALEDRTLMSVTVTEFASGISAFSEPSAITRGPDGNLWFVESGKGWIGRITPTGVVTEFSQGISAGATPNYITSGPDGNLWFTEPN